MENNQNEPNNKNEVTDKQFKEQMDKQLEGYEEQKSMLDKVGVWKAMKASMAANKILANACPACKQRIIILVQQKRPNEILDHLCRECKVKAERISKGLK